MRLESNFDNLIAALTIFKSYGSPRRPCHCEHDCLYVMIDPEKVSVQDKEKLEEYGFIPSDEGPSFISFVYGSA